MKTKIAIIIERADVNLGGAERSVFEMADAISKTGIEVDILAAQGCRDAKNIHILYDDNHSKRTNYFTFARAIKRHLSGNRYSLVHSVLPFPFADVYQPRGGTYAETILRNAESFQNKSIVFYKKLTAFMNFRRSTLLHAERKLCKATKSGPIIVAISKYVAEQFKRHYSVGDDRIVVVPNGIKIQSETNLSKHSSLSIKIFAQLGIKESDNPVFFLFVANNFRLKGLGTLIKAMRLVAAHKTSRPGFLIIVGKGDTKKYQRLANENNSSGVNKRIIFLGPVANIQSVLSMSDVAVLPTFYDPCSRVILEALAASKPVITTRFNGATDLFVDNRHGKVIDSPENIDALTDAIRYFMETKNIENASRAIIEDNLKENISVDRTAKQLLDVYESILQRKGRQ